MKKLCAFILSFVLALYIFTSPLSAYAFSSGANFPAPSSPSDIATIADIVNALVGGVELNVNDYNSAENFLTAYQDKKSYYGGSTSLIDRSNYGHLSQQPSYIDSMFTSTYNNYALANSSGSGSSYILKYNLNKKIWNDWTLYNKFWYKDYGDAFQGDYVIPSLPTDYNFLTYIDVLTISGHDFCIDYDTWNFLYGQNGYWTGVNGWTVNTPHDCTLICPSGAFKHETNNQYDNPNYFFFYDGILTCNYDTSTNTMSYTGNGILNTVFSSRPNNNKFGTFRQNGSTNYIYCLTTGLVSNYDFQTSFQNTNYAMVYLYNHFCNINLYVDGEPWILHDYTAPTVITPELPDVVGGEELPTTTYEVTLPDQEMQVDYNKVIEVIQDQITNGNALTLDDLINGEVFEDTEGNTLDSTAFKTQTIDDAFHTDSAISVGQLPDLPYDSNAITNAFAGVSILAEIVDATQLSLPVPIIITFWGIVLVLLIIGLVGLLHR